MTDAKLPHRHLPRSVDAFAALDYKGQIIINSVRDTRDAVRLLAGECNPIAVRGTPIYNRADR